VCVIYMTMNSLVIPCHDEFWIMSTSDRRWLCMRG